MQQDIKNLIDAMQPITGIAYDQIESPEIIGLLHGCIVGALEFHNSHKQAINLKQKGD